MKAKIQNYQSLKDVEIEVKGLTVVTGANNTGKSAIARAIMGAFTNQRGNSFVRVGESNCEVDITLNDGNHFKWEKGPKINRYTINGKVLEGVGSGSPDEVGDLGVRSVDVDNKTVWPQFGRQFEQIFLLDLPPSVLSSALSDMERVEKLEKAGSNARKDSKKAKARLKVKREDLIQNTKALAEYQELGDASNLMKSISALEAEAHEITTKIDKLKALSDRRARVNKVLTILNQVDEVQLPEEDTESISQLSDKLKAIHKLRRERNKLYIMEGMIGVGLESYPTIDSVDYVKESYIRRLSRLASERKKSLSAVEMWEELQEADIPQSEEDLSERPIKLLKRLKKLKEAEALAVDAVSKLDQEKEMLMGEIGEVCPLCERGEHTH